MHIAEMRVTPIAITDPPLLNAAGLHAPYALRTILEIVTDDGISGLGEVPGNAETTTALHSAAEVITGHDPFQLNAIYAALVEQFGADDAPRNLTAWEHRRIVHVYSAIEVACLDIMGKATGRPVCDLLGGRVRDRVDFSAYLFYKYEGAGGELGFDTDPRRRRLACCSPARCARSRRDRRTGAGHVQRVRLQVHQAQGRRLPA